jgi:iron complex transport system permease protein
MSVLTDAPVPSPAPPPTDPHAPARRVTRAPSGDVVVRTRRLRLSGRVDGRSIAVTLVVLALALAVFAWSLTVGDFPIPLTDVLATLVGRGDQATDFIVNTLRLPRGLVSLLVGAAFGLSGAIFQRLARNPLASPDIIGVNAGAAACAVLVIVLWNGTGDQVTWGALAGAVLTSAAVYLLAYRKGVTGYRLVLVGIGASAMLTSVTSYLMTRAEIYEAQRAMVWLTGSLNARTWDHVRPLVIALCVLVPLAVALARHLRVIDLGDDAARSLGVRVERVRAGMMLAAVALAAVGVASAGPIGFVALVSPQIARRLVGGSSAALLPSAAVGALLLTASDLAARRILAPDELPVGIVTAVLGAPYLLFLLARANRIGSAG